MVEFALVVPIILLLFAAAADLGRLFYAYVAIENAAKEGAFFGSRNPLCDDTSAAGCANPNNVVWRVRSELQHLRSLDGSELTPSVRCLVGDTEAPRASLLDCASGDRYEVTLVYPFRMLTPILGDIIGDLNLSTRARSVVLNLAFDPTPGVSVQKLVSPATAVNGAEVVAGCLEPDDSVAGFYRSPCANSLTPELGDVLYLRFESGATIDYRLTVSNSGAQSLTSLVMNDSLGWPASSGSCPSRPSSLAVGATYSCAYTRTAPSVTGSADEMEYANVVSVDAAQINATGDAATVVVERPPAEFAVTKSVSVYRLGADGDGLPGGFGTDDDIDVSFNSAIPEAQVWFRVRVENIGGRTATAVDIVDSLGPLPFGQNNANAQCPSAPTQLAAGEVFTCWYRSGYDTAGTVENEVTATSPDVVQDANDTDDVQVAVSACAGPNLVIPNLVGLSKSQAVAAWSAAGFTTALVSWPGNNGATVVTQDRQAFDCLGAGTTTTITKDPT